MAENVLFKGTNTRKITATKFLTLTLLIALSSTTSIITQKKMYTSGIYLCLCISLISLSLPPFYHFLEQICIYVFHGRADRWLDDCMCVYEWPHTANNSHQSSLEAPRLTQIRTALRDDNKRYRVIASLLSTSHFLSIIILSFRFPPF